MEGRPPVVKGNFRVDGSAAAPPVNSSGSSVKLDGSRLGCRDEISPRRHEDTKAEGDRVIEVREDSGPRNKEPRDNENRDQKTIYRRV
jgi:hypothetical protein